MQHNQVKLKNLNPSEVHATQWNETQRSFEFHFIAIQSEIQRSDPFRISCNTMMWRFEPFKKSCNKLLKRSEPFSNSYNRMMWRSEYNTLKIWTIQKTMQYNDVKIWTIQQFIQHNIVKIWTQHNEDPNPLGAVSYTHLTLPTKRIV